MPALVASQTVQANAIHSNAQEVFCNGAVRLYKACYPSWEYTGVCGAASLLLQDDVYFIRISNLDVSYSSIIF